jgi:hypothetical protein
MTGGFQIPAPIAYNACKHHKSCILAILDNSLQPELKNLLVSVCGNYIDIYTGDLTPGSISAEILNFLRQNQLLARDKFESWVKYPAGYKAIKITDQSEWILRSGNDGQRYIHIHPAKTGKKTIRFKGSTLKTIYQFKVDFKNPCPDLGLINKARQKISLSPVKKLEPGKGILRCWDVFFGNPPYSPVNPQSYL